MKFRFFFKSFNNEVSAKFAEEVKQTLEKTQCKVSGVIALPMRLKRFCVLRSPHIDKDSREHFEVRIYKRFIDVSSDSPGILNVLFKMEVPAGLACSLTVLEK